MSEASARIIGGAFFRRISRHVRKPRSVPGLIWKNIKGLTRRNRKPFYDHRYWNNIGRALAEEGRLNEALACYDRALAIRPDVPELLNNRGNALCNLGLPDEAETSLRRALGLRPEFANAHYNLGNVLLDLWRPEDAEASFPEDPLLRPQNAKAHHNLGYLYHRLGRFDEAQGVFRAALRLYPDDPELHTSLGHTLLLAGQFEEGWKENEWRRQTKQSVPAPERFFVPSWNGEAIGNRKILLHPGEGGHGDTLQFCRYVPQVATGSKTVLKVQPSLVRLLSQLTGVSEVFAYGDRLPPYDLHCSLMSLPRVLGTTLDTIPATTPYLLPYPTDTARWRTRLAGLPGCASGSAGLEAGGVQPEKDCPGPSPLDVAGDIGAARQNNRCLLCLPAKGPPAAEANRPPLG